MILCSPPGGDGEVDATVLGVAARVGLKRVFRAGGAQAIAAMAYGTESIPKCDKIFGPGNAWVTQAKMLVSQDASGASTGGVTLNADNGLTINDNMTTAGATVLKGNADLTGSGTLTIASGVAVNTTNSALTLGGADLALIGTTNSGSAATSIVTVSTIGLGAGAGTMSISGAELQNITTTNLNIGTPGSGNIT